VRAAEAQAELQTARRDRRTLEPFTDADPALDEQWGYDVQALDRHQRIASGEVVVGAKLGLTSVAKQQRMNVDQPIVGFLTDAMRVTVDSLADDSRAWAQPRIEPEIAFLTGRAINAALTLEAAAHSIEGVAVAAEIIDSRYTGFRFRLTDVVADNTSAAGFLVGPFAPLTNPGDLSEVQCTVTVDERLVHSATGAAILGHPLNAIVWLSEHLARHGQTLPAGSVVLAGALTDAVPLVAGSHYTIEMGALGALSSGL
jgi:2-oxo-3-hexenedioate decarboxylase